MSEELEPALNLNQVHKGKICSSSKFANQNDEDEMSEELDAVLNVDDLVGGSTKKHEQSKFKD